MSNNNNTDKIVSLSGLSRAVTRIREWVESLTHPLTIKYRDNKNQLHEVFVDGNSTQTIDLSKGLYYSDTCRVATRVSNPLSIVNGNEKIEWRGNDHVSVDVRSMRPLYIRNSGSEIVVEDENNQIVDSIQVEQGQFIPASYDLENQSMNLSRPSGIGRAQVHCAKRANGIIGGTDLTSTYSDQSISFVTTQNLQSQFEEFVTFSGKQYAKFKITSASCEEGTSITDTLLSKPYCYLKANSQRMIGYTGGQVIYETIRIKSEDYVYVDKDFITSTINLDPHSTLQLCDTLRYYDIFGGDSVTNGHLYVRVKTGSNTYSMMGVNIMHSNSYPMDSDGYPQPGGGLNYCTTGCVDEHYVIHLDKIYDMIVNDIRDEEHQLLTDKIDIVLPEWLSRDLFRSIKFVDCNVPDNNVFNFSIRVKDGDQVLINEYEKVGGQYGIVGHQENYSFESINGSSVVIKVIKITPSTMGMKGQWTVESNTYL